MQAVGADRVRAEPLELTLYARDAGHERGDASVVCVARSTADVAAAVRVAGAARAALRGSGERHRPGGRRDTRRRKRRDRHDEVEPGARRRRRRRVSRGSSPACSTSTCSARFAHLGLHYAPDPSSQAACTIGGNVGDQRRRSALPGSRRDLGPRARGRRRAPRRQRGPARRAGARRARIRPARDASSGARGRWASPTRVAVRLVPDPPAVRTLLLDFVAIEDAAATVSGIIAAGIIPAALEMMDADITRAVEDFVGAGYPRDAAAVLLVELDGLEAGVLSEVDAVSRDRARARSTVRPGRGRRRRAGAPVEGTQVRVRRDRPDRARLLPARCGRPADAPRRRAPAGPRDLRGGTAHGHERLPCRRRQPAPAARLRRTRAGDLGRASRPPATRSCGRASRRAASCRGSTASVSRSVTRCRLVFTADDLDAQARLRDAFDPAGPVEPGQGPPRGEPLRRARGGPRGHVDLRPCSRRAPSSTSARRSRPQPGSTPQEVARIATSVARRRATPSPCARPQGSSGTSPPT